MNTGEKKAIVKTRSRSVYVATFLQILQGVGLATYGFYQVSTHDWTLSDIVGGWRYIPFPLFESLSSGGLIFFLGLFTLIVAVAFWFKKEWAWLAAMTMQALGLFVGLVNYLKDRPNYIGMLLGIILIFYLNHVDVQETFNRGKPS